ncbi:hypothetical protein GGS26DRAFT_253358 [Hypomontagnella submonticulosa]|nr:hypothetical protein GGS26DRAFT_253358 [Hypomontagnella submonticulosa]
MIFHLADKYKFDVNADDNATGLRDLGALGSEPFYEGVPLSFEILFKNFAATDTLQHGAGLNIKSYYCLVARAIVDFPAAIKPFLNAGADANVALSEAVRRDNVRMAKLCLEYGGDPNTLTLY